MSMPILKLTKLYVLFKNNSLKIYYLNIFYQIEIKKNLKNQKNNLISKLIFKIILYIKFENMKNDQKL